MKYGITVLSSRSPRSRGGPVEYIESAGLKGATWAFKRLDDGRFTLTVFKRGRRIVTLDTGGAEGYGFDVADGVDERVEKHLNGNHIMFLEWADKWLKKNKWAKTWKPRQS